MPGHASKSSTRSNIHGAKVMLCIWWDKLGVIYYELLKRRNAITGTRYRTQLMRLSWAWKEKRSQYQERHDKVILQHDNVRPHVARPVKTYLDNAEMGGLAPTAVLSRRCLFLLQFVPIHGTQSGASAFPFLWRSQKMDRYVDRLKRRIVFSRWYSTVARKRWKKVVASDEQYFYS